VGRTGAGLISGVRRLPAAVVAALEKIRYDTFSGDRPPGTVSSKAMRQELRPLFDRVVIKELEPDRVRQSGLVVPPGSHEPPPQHGIVLSVGPGIDWWESAGVTMPVRPGDHVVFPASAGVWVEVEEEKLLVCRVGELLGVLETADDRSQAGHGAS
jgi:chaperonin GroES